VLETLLTRARHEYRSHALSGARLSGVRKENAINTYICEVCRTEKVERPIVITIQSARCTVK